MLNINRHSMIVNGVTDMPNAQTLRPELADIVRKIRALRTLNRTTGFVLNRTIGDLLKPLLPTV